MFDSRIQVTGRALFQIVVEYLPEWTDQFGYMSNALDWCRENIKPDQIGEGSRLVNGCRQSFYMTCRDSQPRIELVIEDRFNAKTAVCTDTQYAVLDNETEETLALYRPYHTFDQSGKIEWLCVYETVVIQHPIPHQCPVAFVQFIENIRLLLNAAWPLPGTFTLDNSFSYLCYGAMHMSGLEGVKTTQREVGVYALTLNKIKALPVFKIDNSVDYISLITAITIQTTKQIAWCLNQLSGSEFAVSKEQFEAIFQARLDEEWRRLARSGETTKAIEVYRYIYKLPYEAAKQSINELTDILFPNRKTT